MGFWKRILPAIMLVFLAPIIAEYLIGDIPVERLYLLGFVGPIYGFGSLFIREITRRTGRGWPTMIALAFVYGVLEEGVFDQSLFNPHFLNAHLLDYGYIPALGMGSVLTVFVLSLHVVWSISAPIGLVELLFARRRTEAWLGRFGLGISAVLYAAGGTLMTRQFLRTFSASPFQYGLVAIFALVGLAVAFLVLRPGASGSRLAGTAPHPWLIGGFAFGASTIAMLLFQHGKPWGIPAIITAAGILALDVIGLIYIFGSTRRSGWANMHRFALVAGVLLTYCWSGFSTLVSMNGPATIPSHAGLVAACIALLGFLWWKLRRIQTMAQQQGIARNAVSL